MYQWNDDIINASIIMLARRQADTHQPAACICMHCVIHSYVSGENIVCVAASAKQGLMSRLGAWSMTHAAAFLWLAMIDDPLRPALHQHQVIKYHQVISCMALSSGPSGLEMLLSSDVTAVS